MTFEERCNRFKKNTESETDVYKKAYRTAFLEKKKKEQGELETNLLIMPFEKKRERDKR